MAQVIMPTRQKDDALTTIMKGLQIAQGVYGIKADMGRLEAMEAYRTQATQDKELAAQADLKAQERQAAKDADDVAMRSFALAEEARKEQGHLTPKAQLDLAKSGATFSRTQVPGAIQASDDQGALWVSMNNQKAQKAGGQGVGGITIPGSTEVASAPGIKIPGKLSEGQKSADREFGKRYAEYSSGGFAQADANLAKLQSSLDKIAEENKTKDTLSSPFMGAFPDSVRAVADKDAFAIQQDVESVVQESMKSILGAQFTEKEGTAILKRTWNPQLPTSVNVERVQALVDKLAQANDAMKSASQYFEQNGTLAGYRGPQVGVGDIKTAVAQVPTRESGTAFAAPVGDKKPKEKSLFDLDDKELDAVLEAELKKAGKGR